MKRLLFLGCVLPAALLSCAVPEKIDETFYPVGHHEEYRQALVSLELDGTLMGSEWITAGEPASNPTSLSLLPFQERRIFDPSIPDAAYYLIEGMRG